jgi:hypothetical protein
VSVCRQLSVIVSPLAGIGEHAVRLSNFFRLVFRYLPQVWGEIRDCVGMNLFDEVPIRCLDFDSGGGLFDVQDCVIGLVTHSSSLR